MIDWRNIIGGRRQLQRARGAAPLLALSMALLRFARLPAASLRFALLPLALAVVLALTGDARGQAERLIDVPPFDRITLDQANQNAVLDVQTLDLPDRKAIEPKPGGSLTVRLLTEPGEDYEVAWRHIVKVELFEQLVLREANQLVAQQKFDEAYDYFQFLLRRYPELDGLGPSLHAYLYADAGRLFQQQKYDQALAVIEELYRRDRGFRAASPVSEVLGRIVDKLIDKSVQEDRYIAARMLLDRIEKEYSQDQQELIARWKENLSQLAAGRRDEAKQHLENGRFRQAHLAGRAMADIYPDVPGGRELLQEIERRYPLFVVGVMAPAVDAGDPRSLNNWSARRVGRLTRRDLFEFTGYGPEGGQYAFSLGSFEHAQNGKRLVLNIRPGAGPVSAVGASPVSTVGASGASSDAAVAPAASITGYDVARRLLELANPHSPQRLPAWMRLMKSVEVPEVHRVQVDLRTAFVMPEAVLQAPLAAIEPSTGDAAPRGAVYVAAERSDTEIRYAYNPAAPPPPGPRPPEVIERPFVYAAEAIAALERGEIDVIDRLFPADALRLQAEGRVRVGAYVMPSLHVLIPNRDKPFTRNVTFRRALLYAINREMILKQGLLSGGEAPGCQVISGPFPVGRSDDDPMGYAYDARRSPRPYDPRLASVLVKIAENEVIETAVKKGQPAPKLGTLTLAYPASEATRLACTAIAKQLELIKVKVQLLELPPGQATASGDWDLLYAELAMFEPLVDAQRLLGEGGLAFIDTPHVRQTLRDIESATSWSRARERLRQLHGVTHEDVSLLPLYQVGEWFAYRPGLSGLGESPAWLYENLSQWRSTAGKE